MIHKFKACDVNIVLDVNSGTVHVIDDLTYDVLDYYKDNTAQEVVSRLSSKYEPSEIKEAIEELKELESQDMLYSGGKEYENIAANWKSRKPVVKSLCINIAHDCNLRCQYCFASTGEYHGKREMMSMEVGKAAIDFLLKNSGTRKNLEADFFGGEPLMNFDVVKGIVEYARLEEKKYNKNIKFTITTNCVMLDEKTRNYINENMYNVVLSLDGRKEVNDKMRKKVDGSGSYDTILPKIQKMVEERGSKSFYVRGTFTKNNLDFANDVLHMADLNFKNISVEPVVSDEAEEYALKEEDLPKILEEYERLAKEYIKRQKENNGFTFFHFMIDLNQGPCAIKRMSGCSAGSEYLAISPSGDLYPCHQFVGEEEYKMGNVFDGVQNPTLQQCFHDTNIFTKPECSECWAKFYCSGGCAANAYNFNGDIKKPHKMSCELEKKRVECAMAIKAILEEN
jgi:uncharacterized protein